MISNLKIGNMRYLIVILLILSCVCVSAQQGNIFMNIEAEGGYITTDRMPFWLRSNKFGSIPLDNSSMSFIGSFYKEYDSTKARLFDWGGGVNSRINVGQKSNIKLIEGYGKIRLSIFEIKAGRDREIMGICDTSLSSGSFAVSGNAPGIPKVQIDIPEYYTLPFLGNLFAFKASFAHGWVGKTFQAGDGFFHLKTYLHQASLYSRFGKSEWRMKLYGGINHQAFWGSEKSFYNSNFDLSPFETYLYIIAGKSYGADGIPFSKIGNHLGSVDLGFEYKFKNLKLLAYRQNFYDIEALSYLANLRDGLNGISLENTQVTDKGFQWRKLLLELFYSKNQAGEPWSPTVPTGDENYYNNDQFLQGWSYKGFGIGNPFIAPRSYTRNGLPADPVDFFINNRVIVFHFGFEGALQKFEFRLLTSYSLNYGSYGTSEIGHSLGKQGIPSIYGIFPMTRQFSAYLEGNKEFNNGFKFGFITAFDTGQLYYNSFGFLLRATKSFRL